MGEAASHHTRYSEHNCKGVAGSRVRHALSERRKKVKTTRLDHLRAALLAVAAAGLLAVVGLVYFTPGLQRLTILANPARR
jgi:hypothetical protein